MRHGFTSMKHIQAMGTRGKDPPQAEPGHRLDARHREREKRSPGNIKLDKEKAELMRETSAFRFQSPSRGQGDAHRYQEGIP